MKGCAAMNDTLSKPIERANILVVDDTPANLRLLSGLLRDHGYEVRPAPSGELALKAAENDPPDAILLDINMPGMDGYEVCERLKANRKLCDIPVIFISALNETMDRVKAFGVGGVDYVTKPFQFEEVLARVRTHLELYRLQKNLGALVDEQVKQITRLQRSEAIASFAGGIAHDFNNVLFAITGYTKMVKDELPEDTSVSEDLDRVLAAADRATNLVRQILTFSRQTETEEKPVDIRLLVKEAIKFLQATMPATIEIKENVNECSDAVMADPTQLHQVIMNLCTNAFHAMKESGGCLSIELATVKAGQGSAPANPELPTGKYVKLTVSDTGCGMDSKTLSQVFDPFFTTKAPGEGTGLGLAVIHGIVTDRGGEVEIQSMPGEGTTVQVYLPAMDGPGKESVAKAQPLPTGKERILVVDDEVDLSELIGRNLSKLGYAVCVAHDGETALDMLRSSPDSFDLIITDLTMPGITGTQLAEAAIQLLPDIAIIITSGFLEMSGAAEMEQMGIHAVLTKPVTISKLACAVRSALDKEG